MISRNEIPITQFRGFEDKPVKANIVFRRDQIDIEMRLKKMDETRVDVQVLSLTTPMVYWAPPEFGLELSQVFNDACSAIHLKHPDRFLAMAMAPMQAPELAVREIERASRLPGIRGLYLATHSVSGTSSGVFASYSVPISGKTGTAEKVVPLPGYPSDHLEDQSWWCGWGPSDAARLVVCALIENGGHGSSAAAPAALRVFERYFGVKAPPTVVVDTD